MRLVQRWPALLLAASLLSPALAPGTAGAQATPAKTIAPTAAGKVHRLTLKNGSELVGRVLSVDATSVQFESELGITTIAIESILKFRSVDLSVMRPTGGGESFWFPMLGFMWKW